MAAAENAASGLRVLTDFLTPTADRHGPDDGYVASRPCPRCSPKKCSTAW